MIGYLEGTLAARRPGGLFLEVGGVGYRLSCSATTLATLPPAGERCRVYTHLHVREDVLALYGFASEAEQGIFEALLGVSGVGPKVALGVCSAFTPDTLRRALVNDDVAALASVPGIGKRTAQRMVLDLKEKLALPDLQVAGPAQGVTAGARSALENLGYSPSEVRSALGELNPAPGESVEDIVRAALSALARPIVVSADGDQAIAEQRS
ncbi:MAG: Holliday junction branch migration protein RuvA [Actinobacteria bacterium]|nr:Holliday junction branch migration protein RuvA [Actinomycetota bacterium]